MMSRVARMESRSSANVMSLPSRRGAGIVLRRRRRGQRPMGGMNQFKTFVLTLSKDPPLDQGTWFDKLTTSVCVSRSRTGRLSTAVRSGRCTPTSTCSPTIAAPWRRARSTRTWASRSACGSSASTRASRRAGSSPSRAGRARGPRTPSPCAWRTRAKGRPTSSTAATGASGCGPPTRQSPGAWTTRSSGARPISSSRTRKTWCRPRSAPDPARRLRDQLQLAPLLVPGEQVAEVGGGEAALRADRQVLDRYVLRRLIDAPPQLVDGLKLRLLRADEAEDDHLVPGHEAQRLEAAGALRVVLEQEAVDVELLEGPLGAGLVAALRGPGAPVVAAAHVQADGEARRAAEARQRRVVHGDGLVQQAVRVLAEPLHAFTHPALVDDVQQRVELEVGAALVDERLDLAAHQADELVDQVFAGWVELVGEAGLEPAGHAHHDAGDGDLPRPRRVQLQELRVLRQPAHLADLRGDDEPGAMAPPLTPFC